MLTATWIMMAEQLRHDSQAGCELQYVTNERTPFALCSGNGANSQPRVIQIALNESGQHAHAR